MKRVTPRAKLIGRIKSRVDELIESRNTAERLKDANYGKGAEYWFRLGEFNAYDIAVKMFAELVPVDKVTGGLA